LVGKIKNMVQEYFFNEMSKSKNDYFFYIIEEDDMEKRHEKYGCDYRISLPEFKNSFVSIVIINKYSNQIVFATSIILYNENNLDYIHFWRFDQDQKILKKISLIDILKASEFGKSAITLGFSKGEKNFRGKLEISRNFIYLIQRIIVETKHFVFMECTGTQYLDNNLINQEQISLSILNDEVNSCQIGTTRNESIPAEKFFKLIGLTKSQNIFNKRTLGGVYFDRRYLEKNKEHR